MGSLFRQKRWRERLRESAGGSNSHRDSDFNCRALVPRGKHSGSQLRVGPCVDDPHPGTSRYDVGHTPTWAAVSVGTGTGGMEEPSPMSYRSIEELVEGLSRY
jgi:hypothetical protein